ncbi:Flp family type IVb pilin [Falsiroseomonas sp.]|uniref:Flp family type IVb pilin n=1 Tax=Falsiroseomonas sp. TaxID=2870721 RepID=UPI0035648E2B
MLDFAIVSVRRLLADRKGISAVEYGVLGAVIVTVIATAAGLVSGAITTSFTGIQGAMTP